MSALGRAAVQYPGAMPPSSPLRAAAASLVSLVGCADNARLLDAGLRLPDVVLEDHVDVLDVTDVPAPQDLVTARDVSHADLSGDLPLGASVIDGGVRFRVWAPGASSARVTGSLPETPLRREADGVFEGTVVGAREGDNYRYAFTRGDAGFTRIDPRAHVRSGFADAEVYHRRYRHYYQS